MTPQDAKTLEILTAIAEGKEWEYRNIYGGGWKNSREVTFAQALYYASVVPYEIRLKPEVKLRLIHASELPAILWIRRSGTPEWKLATCISGNTIHMGIQSFDISSEICETCVWSEDRKVWHSFEVEASHD